MGHRDAVAVGGSTGAIDALKELCRGLPAQLPAAVLVVVHVGAESRNLLAEILDEICPLPVRTAVDGEPVEPGRVYVAPADHHLLVIDAVVRLGRGPRENMTRPALDPLFRSVGVSYGPRAIGVVLSGKMNDGAAGLADLKRCGGVTVVQNPNDAFAAEMPLGALQASDIDYRAPIAEMAALVTELVAQEPGPATPVRRDVELEVDIALGRPCLTETIGQIADPVPLSCPSCSGVLSQVRRTPPLRYRCQVGHAYTAEALASEQQAAAGEPIRVALRILEERAVLCERMEADARAKGRSRTGFGAKAEELRRQAEILRKAALGVIS